MHANDLYAAVGWLLIMQVMVLMGLLLFICTVVIEWPFYCILLVLLMGALRSGVMKMRHRELPSRQGLISSLRPPSDQALDPDDICAFCRDKPTDPAALPCGHIFCLNCVSELVERYENCPLCQRHLFVQDPVGRHIRDMLVGAITIAFLLLDTIGGEYDAMLNGSQEKLDSISACMILGPSLSLQDRLGWFLRIVAVDGIGMVLGQEFYEGFIPGYDSLPFIRKTFGRAVEEMFLRVLWTFLLLVAIAQVLSLAMSLQIMYASFSGSQASDFEHAWAWPKP